MAKKVKIINETLGKPNKLPMLALFTGTLGKGKNEAEYVTQLPVQVVKGEYKNPITGLVHNKFYGYLMTDIITGRKRKLKVFFHGFFEKVG